MRSQHQACKGTEVTEARTSAPTHGKMLPAGTSMRGGREKCPRGVAAGADITRNHLALEPRLLSGKHATHKGWEPYSGLIETHVGQVHMPATSPGQAGGCPAHVPGGENTHTKHTRGHTHGHTWAHMQTMVMHRHTQGLSRGDTWGHMRHTWTHNIHGDTY